MQNKKLSMLVLLFAMVSMSFNPVQGEIDTDPAAIEFKNKRLKIFTNLLHDKQGSDMNFDYVAYITKDMNLYTFELFIQEAINCAAKDGSEMVMMKHLFMANHILWPNEKLIDLEEDNEDDMMKYPDHIRALALHEAGHAIATLYSSAGDFLYIYKIHLQSDSTKNEYKVGANYIMNLFQDEADLTEEELEDFCKVDVGGYASEVVFQQFALESKQLDGNDADCFEAHTHQILKKRSSGIVGLKEQAEETAQLQIKTFQESCQLIALHKDKVEKLALALLKKKIVYADEIYEICGVEKPKLEIRKKSA